MILFLKICFFGTKIDINKKCKQPVDKSVGKLKKPFKKSLLSKLRKNGALK